MTRKITDYISGYPVDGRIISTPDGPCIQCEYVIMKEDVIRINDDINQEKINVQAYDKVAVAAALDAEKLKIDPILLQK